MFEEDETVAFDEEAQYVGRICRQDDPNQVLVDKVHRQNEKCVSGPPVSARLAPYAWCV